MKISDLVKRTQVSKETIHYYVREGLVPRPRKFAKNLASYNESYVERIRLIKELQDHHFLPRAHQENSEISKGLTGKETAPSGSNRLLPACG